MEREGIKTRDIRFFSQKNQQMVCVHSRQARDYVKKARILIKKGVVIFQYFAANRF